MYFDKVNELEKLKLIKEDKEFVVLEIEKKISNLGLEKEKKSDGFPMLDV